MDKSCPYLKSPIKTLKQLSSKNLLAKDLLSETRSCDSINRVINPLGDKSVFGESVTNN